MRDDGDETTGVAVGTEEVKPTRVAESLDVYILGTETNIISAPVLKDPGTGIISFLHVK